MQGWQGRARRCEGGRRPGQPGANFHSLAPSHSARVALDRRPQLVHTCHRQGSTRALSMTIGLQYTATAVLNCKSMPTTLIFADNHLRGAGRQIGRATHSKSCDSASRIASVERGHVHDACGSGSAGLRRLHASGDAPAAGKPPGSRCACAESATVAAASPMAAATPAWTARGAGGQRAGQGSVNEACIQGEALVRHALPTTCASVLLDLRYDSRAPAFGCV